MDRMFIVQESKDMVEFSNGLIFTIEDGRLSINENAINESTDLETIETPPYCEVIPQLELPLTHKCNLGCVYCTFRDRMKGRTDLEMSWDIIDQSIVYFKEYLEKQGIQYARIDFGVTGEPFLRKDMFEKVLSHINNVFKDSTVKRIWAGPYISNATFPIIENLLIEFCDAQDVSCDGPKDIHDSMRVYPNGNGTFDDFMKSLKAIEEQEPRFGVSAVLTAQNPDFTRIFNYLHTELNFQSIYMKPANLKHEISYSLNESNLDVYKKSYTLLIDNLVSQKPEVLLSNLLAFNKEDFLMRFFYRIKERSKQIYRCGCGKSGIYVDTDGQMYPCAHFIGLEKYEMGNLTTGIDEKKRKEYFQLTVFNREPCNRCWARYLCGGGCYYQSVLANNSVNKPDKIKCELIKHLIIESIRLYFFMKTETPDVLDALPSIYYLSKEDIDASPSTEYRPQATFKLSEKETCIQVISKKTMKGVIHTEIPSLQFSLKKQDNKIIFYFYFNDTLNFNIDFWFCNLDSCNFLKGDLYNMRSFLFGDTIRINEEGQALQLQGNLNKIQKIPYSNAKWKPCEAMEVVYGANSLEVHCDFEKLYGRIPSCLGLNMVFNFSEGGYASLVTNEPYCLLNAILDGYYTLHGGEFDENAYHSISTINMSELNNMIPIGRWRGMKPNVC